MSCAEINKDVKVDVSNYNTRNLINFLSINHTTFTELVAEAIKEKIGSLDFDRDEYDFVTYPITEENINIIKKRIIDKYGTLAEYARSSGINKDFLYSIFSGKRTPAQKTWTQISYDARYVKYN